MNFIEYSDFEKVELRVGKVTAVEDFPEARKPAYKLSVDFGPQIGVKRSSAQATHYSKEELLNSFVICVLNFQPKQIGPFISECLVCGVPMLDGKAAILTIREKNVSLGGKAF